MSSPVSPVDERLCSLLENEFFLAKVLEHLVDDGLHECRRVCHKWRRVCGRLPVKLGQCEAEKLAQVCELFPNATSASVYVESTEQMAEIERLANLRQPGQLGLTLTDVSVLALFSSMMHSFEHLVYLCLNLRFKEAQHVRDLYSSLGQLTNLTELDLYLWSWGPVIEIQPLTQLSKMRRLSLNEAPFVNEEGQLLFQPTSSLTSLALALAFFDFRKNEQVLESIRPYMRRLQSLSFDFCSAPSSYWTMLGECTGLESLRLRRVQNTALCKTLKNVRTLTALTIDSDCLSDREVWDSILSLTGLRSLDLYHENDRDELSFEFHSFSRLTGLTDLAVSGFAPGKSLCTLTGLVQLMIHYEDTSCHHLQATLEHLSGLECLILATSPDQYLEIEGSSLVQLKKLRILELDNVSVDADFIPTLANLSELTTLILEGTWTEMPFSSFLSQLSLLSNLRCLVFETGEANQDIDLFTCFPVGSFPRLRSLHVNGNRMSEDERRELFIRLPSLHKLR